ncbi:unnamed protein product [Rotaria sordida]|uniref:Uncharacterized protein n=1 Tax=Rotaria sordida TaxID=392033 RepID=A0A815D9J0_9BILA|nr:unnamed protein product [Rotaria sordida]CAF1570108.1 unnamed protein product [Rotaria sordida]
MQYSAAYLLAVLDDNSSPDVAAAAKLLSIVRIECNEECARKLVDACQGKDNKRTKGKSYDCKIRILFKVDNVLTFYQKC